MNSSPSITEHPILSVVMPSYNHEKFINYAISSVTNQSFKNLELIIVDDSSQDSSRDIIKRRAQNDNRIKIIFHDKNEGIAKTSNDGITEAKGKYIAMMASDDMFKEGGFTRIIAALEALDDYGGAIIEGKYIDEENRSSSLFSKNHGAPSIKQGYMFKDLVKSNFVCTGVFRRSIVEKFQILYNQELRYFNDWLFWLELSAVAKFVYIDEPLYYYRRHSGNTSKSQFFQSDHLKLYDVIFKKYHNSLDLNSIGVLIRKKGEAYRDLLNDFKTYRNCLYQCMQYENSTLQRAKLSFLILLNYSPDLYRFYSRIKKSL